MSDPLRVSSPLIPKEVTLPEKQAPAEDLINLVQPERVVKPTESSDVKDNYNEQNIRDNLGKALFEPVLKTAGETVELIRKLLILVETGDEIFPRHKSSFEALFESIYIPPEQLTAELLSQDRSAVLFKGEFFDILRNALEANPENARLKESILRILKHFDCNVNTENSKNTILQNCYNLTEYMFSEDKNNFLSYISKLEKMLDIADQTLDGQRGGTPGSNPGGNPGAGVNPGNYPAGNPGGSQGIGHSDYSANSGAAEPRTVFQQQAATLKNNLTPLLGDIVRQYNQEEGVRNSVMSIINSIVRFDKGDPSALRDAVSQFIFQFRQLRALPENFESKFFSLLDQTLEQVKQLDDETTRRMTEIVSKTLSEAQNPAAFKLAENVMFNMVQHQSPIMNLLHFFIPLQIDGNKCFGECYIDPDSDERKGSGGSSRTNKIFLKIESDEHGPFEMSFWVYDRNIDLSLCVQQPLVEDLSKIKSELSGVVSQNGYNLGKYDVHELIKPKNIAQVFPKLITRRVGIDVRA